MKRYHTFFYVLCALSLALLLGFCGWALSGHGSLGMLRVNPVFLYALILAAVIGLVFAGLVLLYWRLSLKGRVKKGLSVFLLFMAVIGIVFYPFAFVQAGGLPPSPDIQHVNRLALSPAGEDGFRFAAGSDAHFGAGNNSPEKTAAMLAQIAGPANQYSAFFFLGDLVEYGFRDKQWAEALQAFAPAAAAVPVRFAPGNHDTLFGGLSRYLRYVAPEKTPSGSRLWSRVDAGNIHFLLLDVEWTAETVTKAQLDWLEEQLQTIPAGDWKIVMSHGFYYGSGSVVMGWKWYDNPETINALAPLFEKYGVDMVFSGHNHYLEYLRHSDVNYVVCGGFGGQPDPPPDYISPASVWYLASQSGFADCTISGNTAALNFRGPDGDIYKSFTIRKSVPAGLAVNGSAP